MRFILLLCGSAVIFAQTTVSLNGTTYTLNSHPLLEYGGPSGAVYTRSCTTGGGQAPKAIAGNPAWVSMGSDVANHIATYQSGRFALRDGNLAASFATYWCGDNTQTAAHDAALFMLNNVEEYVPFVCVESLVECGVGGGGFGITGYGVTYWLPNWIRAYELMRGEMTSPQRQAFVAKMVNDLSLWGGTNGSSGSDCTNPTTDTGFTASVTTTTMTASSPVFGTTINVGDWVYTVAGNQNIAYVVSFSSSTVATLDNNGMNGVSASELYTRPQAFDASANCGFVWAVKHGRFTPLPISGGTHYPPDGGVNGADVYGQGNLVWSALWGLVPTFLSLAGDDANATPRSQAELTSVYNSWFNFELPMVKDQWTGHTTAGSAYTVFRANQFLAGTAQSITGSISSPSLILLDNWAKNQLIYDYMSFFPAAPNALIQWGQAQPSGASLNNGNMQGFVTLLNAYSSTTEGQRANYFMQNLWTNQNSGLGTLWTMGSTATQGWLSTNLTRNGCICGWYFYTFTDPAFGTSDLANAPTQKAFNVGSAGGPGTSGPLSALLSRTGFKSVVDTFVSFFADYRYGIDHQWAGGNMASYKILKGNYLLGEDFGGASSYGNAAADAYVGDAPQRTNYIQLGADSNVITTSAQATPVYMTRANDSNAASSFAYAMVDATQSYVAGAHATRVWRHLVHFKKVLTQDFVVTYDDVAVSQALAISTFLHYANNGQTSEGATSLSGVQVTSTNPGTGNGDASQLLSQVLLPAGVNSLAVFTDGSNGSYTGGNGQTYRVHLCTSTDGSTCNSSATTEESIVVHEPVAGSGNTLPTLGLIGTIDANWRGVEIDGASPKIAVFARSGSTYTSSTFTTAHSGTAQYLVAGLTAGSYAVTVGGSAVSGSPFTVASSDNSLYFESTAGAVVVSQIGASGGSSAFGPTRQTGPATKF